MADSFDKSSTLNIDGEVLNRSSFTKSADNTLARRVVIAAPSPADQPGPIGIELTSEEVDDGSSAGTLVGELLPEDSIGTGPFTFTITQDLDNKFQIQNVDELRLSSGVDYATKTSHNLTIEIEDANGKTAVKSFTIDVNPIVSVDDREVKSNGIDEWMTSDAWAAVQSGDVSFTLAFSFTIRKINVEQILFSTARTSSNLRGFTVGINSDNRLYLRLTANFPGLDYLQVRSNPTFSINTKYHIFITYNGSREASGITFYRNNSGIGDTTEQDTLSTATVSSNQDMFYFRNPAGASYAQANLDHIMLFDKVLDSSERSEVWNGGAVLSDLTGTSVLASNDMHVPINSTDVYPNLVDKRGNYDITMNVNMSQSNIVVV